VRLLNGTDAPPLFSIPRLRVAYQAVQVVQVVKVVKVVKGMHAMPELRSAPRF
jgi:hypothetical protein